MIVTQAFRYELDPNNVQRTLLAKHAGAARFAWNWGLARRIERFEKHEGRAKLTSAVEQHRELNALKQTEFPWMYEVSKCAPQEALRDLDRAFRDFWRARKKRSRIGFPKFKKKGVHDAFRLTGAIHVNPCSGGLPRLGEIRTKEDTSKLSGRILSATVSREADRWYVSFAVERERPDPEVRTGRATGIDVGLDCFAVLSDRERIEAPKPLARSLERLKTLSKKHSRRMKGSKNRKKSAMRVARLHRRIRNQRRDFLHKVTTRLAKTKPVLVVEALHVRGMVRNRHLSRAISDAGWSEFQRLLGYKCPWYGSRLVVAPRFYPSSKMCSMCWFVMGELPLSIREWDCPNCGAHHDRDDNAAANLELYEAVRPVGPEPAVVLTANACGDRLCSGTGLPTRATSTRSLKQEVNTTYPRGIDG